MASIESDYHGTEEETESSYLDTEEVPSEEQIEFQDSEEEPSDEDLKNIDSDSEGNIPINDSIGMYLRDITKVPLLQAEEEIDLAKRIEQAKNAQTELEITPQSETEQYSKLQTIIADGHDASHHLTEANTRLVVSIAKRYVGRGVQFLDLIQEGNLGLMKAVEKFDYRRGHRFSTYATWWIRQTVSRAVADQGRTIRIPVHKGEEISHLSRARHVLTQDLGTEPTDAQLADALDITEKRVQNLKKHARHARSIEEPTGPDGERTLLDSLEDDSPGPAAVAETNGLKKLIEDKLSELTPREAEVLKLRYGFENEQQYTLEEIGKKFGVTRERIRQIEAKALRQLRRPKHSLELKDFLDRL